MTPLIEALLNDRVKRAALIPPVLSYNEYVLFIGSFLCSEYHPLYKLMQVDAPGCGFPQGLYLEKTPTSYHGVTYLTNGIVTGPWYIPDLAKPHMELYYKSKAGKRLHMKSILFHLRKWKVVDYEVQGC